MPKAAKPARKPPISRAPRGDVHMRRVLVSLLPEEHEELKRRSYTEGRSASSLARIFLLRGMQLERRGQTADDTPVDPSDITKEN